MRYSQKTIFNMAAILNLQNFGILLSSRPCKRNLHLRTNFRWNRMISGWDIAIKPFSKWRPSAILNFRKLVFWSYDLYYNVILLYPTKFRVNRMIICRDIARRRFSIWRPSAVLNLQNFSILLSIRLWKHNLHLHTKFHLNRMIFGWNIAIKPFSKWRPKNSAILNFRNLIFWSYQLC